MEIVCLSQVYGLPRFRRAMNKRFNLVGVDPTRHSPSYENRCSTLTRLYLFSSKRLNSIDRKKGRMRHIQGTMLAFPAMLNIEEICIFFQDVQIRSAWLGSCATWSDSARHEAKL